MDTMKGLAHEVVVNIFGLFPQLIEHVQKFRLGHTPRRARMPVAKGAIHITDICDFNICP